MAEGVSQGRLAPVPGQIRDDSQHPHDQFPTQAFLVDEGTLARLEKGMIWNPGRYQLNNGFLGYNCTGRANQVLYQAGIPSGYRGFGANPWQNHSK